MSNASIDDMASNPHIDFLIVGLDSEELSYADKFKEIHEVILENLNTSKINYKIII